MRDHRREITRNGAGDADRYVRLVPLIGANLHSQTKPGQVDGVFVAVTQRSLDQIVDRGAQSQTKDEIHHYNQLSIRKQRHARPCGATGADSSCLHRWKRSTAADDHHGDLGSLFN